MYIPTIGPRDAKIMVIGKAPASPEEFHGKPFMGKGGQLLDQIFANVGISRHDVMLTNVCREKLPGNNINYCFKDGNKRKIPKDFLSLWLSDIKQEILTFRPHIIVTLGEFAYWAICGERGIMAARGYITESSLVPGQKVLPTISPEQVILDWKLRAHLIFDMTKAINNSDTPKLPIDNRAYHLAVSANEFKTYTEYLTHDHTDPIALDIEWQKGTNKIDIVGLASSAVEATNVQFVHAYRNNHTVEQEVSIWKNLGDILTAKEVIMQNGKFDKAALWYQNGIYIHHFYFDTLIAGHVIWPEFPRSLAFLASICLNVQKWKHTSSTSELLYNAQDCCNTFGIHDELKPILAADANYAATFQNEMQQNDVAVLMELQGIYTDPVKRDALRQELTLQSEQLKSELTAEIGREINFNSSQQVQRLLYGELGLPTQYKRRKSASETRKVTTDATALNNLYRKTNNEILDMILRYKKLVKLLTFVDIPLSDKSCAHTCYNITGANMALAKTSELFITDSEESHKSFGRWSSSKSIIMPYGSGNLQNIPYQARKIYTAPKGMVILQADYKQAEAVVVAYLINDARLKKLFQDSFGQSKQACDDNDWDIHKITASMMFGVPTAKVDKEQRNKGKKTRHAKNYSMGPKTLADNIGVTLAEGRALSDAFDASCPQLKLWQESIKRGLQTNRTLVNLLGRKHTFMERYGDRLYRSAYAYIPQSTVGDLLNTAIHKLYHTHGDWLTVYLQLHDAIYILVDEDLLAKAVQTLRKTMLMPLKHKDETFTIDVDFSCGKSWGELEDLEWQDYR